eukprot:gene22984-30172_t
MFLVTREVAHEKLWYSFLEQAASLEPPTPPPRGTFNKINLPTALQRDLFPKLPHQTEKELFPARKYPAPSVKLASSEYNVTEWGDRCQFHAPLKWEVKQLKEELRRLANAFTPKLDSKSIFYNRYIRGSVNTSGAYAMHALSKAFIALLGAAVRDPLNQKFILLSESCLPLYPPEVMYAQLMAEGKSRINACGKGHGYDAFLDDLDYRWQPLMDTQFFHKKHFRKSSQWVSLSRLHAELVVADRHVEEMFSRYCYGREDPERGMTTCVSDEAYVGSLLAAYDLDNQTDCLGGLTYVEWPIEHGSSSHPRTFVPWDITGDMISCIATAQIMQKGADKSKVPANLLDESGKVWAPTSLAGWALSWGYKPLDYTCPLVARKFPKELWPDSLCLELSCSGVALGSCPPPGLAPREHARLNKLFEKLSAGVLDSRNPRAHADLVGRILYKRRKAAPPGGWLMLTACAACLGCVAISVMYSSRFQESIHLSEFRTTISKAYELMRELEIKCESVQGTGSKDDLTRASEELDAATKRCQEAAADLQKCMSDLNVTKTELRSTRAQFQQVSEDLTHTRSKLEEAQGELGLTRSENLLLQRELDNKKRLLESAQGQMNRFEADASDARNAYEEWED